MKNKLKNEVEQMQQNVESLIKKRTAQLQEGNEPFVFEPRKPPTLKSDLILFGALFVITFITCLAFMPERKFWKIESELTYPDGTSQEVTTFGKSCSVGDIAVHSSYFSKVTKCEARND